MDLVWRDTYENAVEAFGGQQPGRQLEADLIERFEQTPAALIAAIDKLAERFKAGRVHSPWPLVLRELDEAPARDQIHASDESERIKAVHLAERYIATAGMFMPESEILAELFGTRGRLELWAGDELLRKRILDCWQARQPDAMLVEREQLERAERWKAGQLAMQHLGIARTSAAHEAQPQQPSQTRASLTAVSADVDADIAW